MKHSWPLLLTAALTSGCGSLRQPPLPQSAQIAAVAPAPMVDDAWAAKVRSADAIYFSLTESAMAAGQPIWHIVRLLQASGQPVALGWAEVPATQQPLFEQWKGQEISAAQLLDQLVRPERAAFFRGALRPDLGHAALGCPGKLLGKIRDGETLSEEEQAQLPTGFHPRPDAFEIFADRVTASARLRRYNIRRLYRAHLVAEQTIAENIVRFRREHPQWKLLVFLPNDAMIDPREVAAFAAQKMPLRQLILDRSQPLQEAQPQLLARGRRSLFKVVDCSPGAARHDRRLAAPRLRA
ncbi:MAG: ChaN family lipoprotein [Chthoniobacterales bacterium]|nr:ChaN family lipoprotein [Chthoniobacterales bacterium]